VEELEHYIFVVALLTLHDFVSLLNKYSSWASS
jgi:hypothetical protein